MDDLNPTTWMQTVTYLGFFAMMMVAFWSMSR
jgi:hypothetical protein